MRKFAGLPPVAALFALCMSSASANMDITLKVIVDGGTPNTGQIIATLFDSETSYMKAPFAEQTNPVDAIGAAVLIFKNLAPGDYAVSVVYDENANGKLDTGFLGIPKEKIGFSNNAKPRIGPAPYEKARFGLTPETSEITITLKRPKRE